MNFFHTIYEFILIILYLIASPLQFLIPSQKNHAQTNKPTVIFLHGWYTQYPIYFPLISKLHRLGYDIHLPNLGYHARPTHKIVRQLHVYIKKHQLTNIIIIGHSFGGIIALAYAQKYPKDITQIITIASPFHGAPLAEYFPFKLCTPAHELTAHNHLLQKITKISPKLVTKITSIYSIDDEIVPYTSCNLLGIHNKPQNNTGHVSIVFSSATWQEITKTIHS